MTSQAIENLAKAFEALGREAYSKAIKHPADDIGYSVGLSSVSGEMAVDLKTFAETKLQNFPIMVSGALWFWWKGWNSEFIKANQRHSELCESSGYLSDQTFDVLPIHAAALLTELEEYRDKHCVNSFAYAGRVQRKMQEIGFSARSIAPPDLDCLCLIGTESEYQIS